MKLGRKRKSHKGQAAGGLVGRGLLRDCTTSPINRFAALVITVPRPGGHPHHRPGVQPGLPVLAARHQAQQQPAAEHRHWGQQRAHRNTGPGQ